MWLYDRKTTCPIPSSLFLVTRATHTILVHSIKIIKQESATDRRCAIPWMSFVFCCVFHNSIRSKLKSSVQVAEVPCIISTWCWCTRHKLLSSLIIIIPIHILLLAMDRNNDIVGCELSSVSSKGQWNYSGRAGA